MEYAMETEFSITQMGSATKANSRMDYAMGMVS